MDPISNIDQLVLALRRRLLERSAIGAARRKPANGSNAAGLDSIYALARIDGVDDSQLGRALVQNILGEHFGPDLINEAKFQQLVDRVVDTFEMDAAGSKILSLIVGELRAAAR